MTERGWVTLVVRLFGLWFLIGGAASIAGAAMQAGWAWVADLAFPGPSMSSDAYGVEYVLIHAAHSAAWVLGGWWLVFRADGLINAVCRQVVGRCAGCGYDVSACAADACPECNAPLRRAAQAPAAPAPAAPAPAEGGRAAAPRGGAEA